MYPNTEIKELSSNNRIFSFKDYIKEIIPDDWSLLDNFQSYTHSNIVYNGGEYSIYYNKSNKCFVLKSESIRYTTLLFNIPEKRYEDTTYCVIDGYMFFFNDEKKGKVLLTSEYSSNLGKINVILDKNNEIEFTSKTYSKYPRYDGNSILINDKAFKISDININIEDFSIVKSNLEILNSTDREDVIIPIDINIDNKDKTIFIIVRNEKLFVFHKISGGVTINNLLYKKFKPIKYKRKNTDYFIYKDMIVYINDKDRGSLKILSLKEYDVNSIVALSQHTIKIKDLNGNDNVISGGYYNKYVLTLNHKYEDYDLIQINANVFGLVGDYIEINNKKILYKDNTLYLDNNRLIKNIFLEDNMLVYKNENSILGDYKAKINIDIANYFNIDTENYDKTIYYEDKHFIHFSYKSNYYLYSYITENKIKLNENDKLLPYGYDSYSYKDYEIVTNNKILVHYFENRYELYILGHFIEARKIFIVKKINSDMFNNILEEIKNNLNLDSKYSKEDLEDIIEDSLYNILLKEFNKYDINITKENILEIENEKDLTYLCAGLKNIDKNIKDNKQIFIDIEQYIKNGARLTDSEFFKTKNISNDNSFSRFNLSIEKFCNYDGSIKFKSTADKNNTKSSVAASIYTQIKMLIGSRKDNVRGILQISNIKDIEILLKSYLNIEANLDNLEGVDCNTIKIINECGKLIFKILKKYNITLDSINNEIIINSLRYNQVKISKLLNIGNDIIECKNKIFNLINKSNINKEIKSNLMLLIDWSIKHLVDDINSVPTNVKDSKEQEFTISLWDRNNIINSLLQGTKTHCCLAIDSSNIGELVNYIYMKNINLVEIKHKGETIGQAFVSMYVTHGKYEYRYMYKRHIFMVIDNIELNSNFAEYKTDIAINLQRYMNDYSNYVSSEISDVLLGTMMNDIQPPYKFELYLNIDIIGEHDLYKDNTDRFYKFL